MGHCHDMSLISFKNGGDCLFVTKIEENLKKIKVSDKIVGG